MEWCVDAGNPAASSIVADEVCKHLYRHAAEPAVVELARPTIERALGSVPKGPAWLSLDWEDRQARLRVSPLPPGPLPGSPVGPGVTRAHEEAARLWSDHEDPEAPLFDLNVVRLDERDIDLSPADPAKIADGGPATLVGLIGGEISAGRTLEEAAARAGATVAATEAAAGPGGGAGNTERDPAGGAGNAEAPEDARAVAELFVDTERRLGAEFEIVSADGTRAVVRNRRCPFGPGTTPAMCRFTSALAGGLSARAAGQADVTMLESLASGDPECRLVIDLTDKPASPVSHRYRWPPPAETLEAPSPVRGFQVMLTLQLPRDRVSVPITRHLVRAALDEVGVVTEDGDDVELAVTEACANVIDHSGPGDAYDVSFAISPSACHIRVVDIGRGFDHDALNSPSMASGDAEHGRGVALMHALVDQVHFESEPERGTIVHLVKKLRFDDTALAAKLITERG